jgi:4-alpha-glucanotransferase
VGDLSDLPGFCRWLASAGQTVLQLLPLAEMAIHETSPYGALTAFGLDPLYLDLDTVEDFDALGGIASLPSATRADLDAARSAATVAYAGVRRAKAEALAAAFARFEKVEAESGSSRAAALDRFIEAESWWLAAYVSFRALLDAHGHQNWSTWEPASHTAGPAGFRELAPPLARAARYHAWVQWLLAEQWAAARREAAALGVRLYGDMPFMVSAQSADVWARQDEFRLDATIGAPPDAFSDDGQDWGLPVMRWDVMAANDCVWWRARCRRAAALFDGVRLDHDGLLPRLQSDLPTARRPSGPAMKRRSSR